MTPLLLLLGSEVVLLDTVFGSPLAVPVSSGESLVDPKTFLNFPEWNEEPLLNLLWIARRH